MLEPHGGEGVAPWEVLTPYGARHVNVVTRMVAEGTENGRQRDSDICHLLRIRLPGKEHGHTAGSWQVT